MDIKTMFFAKALPVELIGMNLTMMCKYIKFCRDHLQTELGCKKHYDSKQPFEWMTMISLQGKFNFFEKRVSKYFKAKVGTDPNNCTFSLDSSLNATYSTTTPTVTPHPYHLTVTSHTCFFSPLSIYVLFLMTTDYSY